MTHICVSKLAIIGSDNGLSPGRRQAIIRTVAGILSIRTLRTKFSEILSEIYTFLFKKMDLKMSAVRWRPFRLGLNVLNTIQTDILYCTRPQITSDTVSYKSLRMVFYWRNSIYNKQLTQKSTSYPLIVKRLISGAPNPKTKMFLVSSCSCLCPIH